MERLRQHVWGFDGILLQNSIYVACLEGLHPAPLHHLPEYLLFISIVQLKPIKLFTDSNEQRKKYIRVKRVVARRFGKRAKWRWKNATDLWLKQFQVKIICLRISFHFSGLHHAHQTQVCLSAKIKRSGNKKGFCAMESCEAR